MAKKKEKSNIKKAREAVEKLEKKLIPLRLIYTRMILDTEWERMEEAYGHHLDYEYFIMDLEHDLIGQWDHEKAYKKGKLQRDVFEDHYYEVLQCYVDQDDS